MLISPLSSLSDLSNAAHISDRDPSNEPLLCMDNIQGNGIVGFNKDYQQFLFLKISDPSGFRQWLATQLGFIATAAEVLAFNRLFKALKIRRGQEGAVKATWTNIVLSAPALKGLLSAADFSAIADTSFTTGLAAQSSTLNDPTTAGAPGTPASWQFGGPNNEADVMLIVASDDQKDLDTEVKRLRDSITTQNAAKACMSEMYSQQGATLLGDMRGHEHFGWRDGVSQPGIRGVVSPDATGKNIDVITARQNANDASQGQPGQDCLYPGAFVFGYPGQNPTDADAPGPSVNGGLNLFDDGSLVVVRRLQQDVQGFHNTITTRAALDFIDPDILGAKLVGRFKDGSPLVVVGDGTSQTEIGTEDAFVNWFDFQEDPPHTKSAIDGSQFDLSAGAPSNDPDGLKCPFAAHVRKMYPRDDENANSLNEAQTQTHRMLRRGIPYGTAFDPTAANDNPDRGLFFVSYQTSIMGQFEFVTKHWANDPNFRSEGAGYDPIIGQSAAANRDRSTVVVTFTGGRDRTTVDLPADFVTPTGGGYFVSLSIDALATIAGTPNVPLRCHAQHPIITKPPTPTPTQYPSA